MANRGTRSDIRLLRAASNRSSTRQTSLLPQVWLPLRRMVKRCVDVCQGMCVSSKARSSLQEVHDAGDAILDKINKIKSFVKDQKSRTQARGRCSRLSQAHFNACHNRLMPAIPATRARHGCRRGGVQSMNGRSRCNDCAKKRKMQSGNSWNAWTRSVGPRALFTAKTYTEMTLPKL